MEGVRFQIEWVHTLVVGSAVFYVGIDTRVLWRSFIKACLEFVSSALKFIFQIESFWFNYHGMSMDIVIFLLFL